MLVIVAYCRQCESMHPTSQSCEEAARERRALQEEREKRAAELLNKAFEGKNDV